LLYRLSLACFLARIRYSSRNAIVRHGGFSPGIFRFLGEQTEMLVRCPTEEWSVVRLWTTSRRARAMNGIGSAESGMLVSASGSP
jgi:hypothetical protein